MFGHAPTQRRHPLYRLTDAAPEVLPVHPGGPFWAKNDDGAWSIPAKTQSRHRARRPLAGLLPCEEDAVHGPNAQRSGRCRTVRRTGKFDPKRAFEIAPMNGR
jgi:predicted NUDIX family NTP pyrophosphohydrolase